MNQDKPYRKLIAWQRADLLAREVYAATKDFPNHELYGVVSQLRRASLSVALNIVEGFGRQGAREKRRFFQIALGSLAETDYLLYFCHGQEFLDDKTYERIENIRCEAGAVLWGYFRTL